MGTPEYVANALNKVVDSMQAQAEGYDILSRQDAMILLRFCLAPRPTYLLRVLPPSVTVDFAERSSNVLRSALCKIAGRPTLSDADFQAAALPYNLGGLGFHCPTMTRVAASLACMKKLLYRPDDVTDWTHPVLWDVTDRHEELANVFAELRVLIDPECETSLDYFTLSETLQQCPDLVDFLDHWREASTPLDERETVCDIVDRTTAGMPCILGRTGASLTEHLKLGVPKRPTRIECSLNSLPRAWPPSVGCLNRV